MAILPRQRKKDGNEGHVDRFPQKKKPSKIPKIPTVEEAGRQAGVTPTLGFLMGI